MRFLPLALLLAVLAPPALAQPDVAGTWAGRLETGMASLRIVFHLTPDSTGYAAALDSPDQGAFGIPAGPVTQRGDSLTIAVPAVQGGYDGVVRSDSLIEGTWRQMGSSLPLVLRRGEAAALNRPQEPQPPYPYDEQEVRFAGGAPDVELAGTLTRPRDGGPHPAVILVSGSGPQDRDEALVGHKPFKVLADHLTRRGIAVLRYDDRGVAESTGAFETAVTADFAADAAAAVAFLAAQDGIAEVGVIGHSEGAMVAPMVAQLADAVDFVVLLAPPAVPGDSLLVVQSRLIFEALGVPKPAVATYNEAQREVFRLARDPDADPAAIEATIAAGLDRLSPEEQAYFGVTDSTARGALITQQAEMLRQPWMQSFLAYDPRPALAALDIPVLALFGGRDLQVPPDLNRPPLEEALAGNAAARIEVLPDLNHLFQTAATGLPTEYGQIEETFAPAALDLIADWIREVTGDS